MARSLVFMVLCFLFRGIAPHDVAAKNIGICIVATNKYIHFVEPLIESCRKYFLPHHNLTYFVFTNRHLSQPTQDIVTIYRDHRRWPYSTMLRCEAYVQASYLFEGMDYMFAIDADMLLVDQVEELVLSDRVGTLHPGFLSKPGSYETSIQSRAFVKVHKRKEYFAGGFYGGSTAEFNKINKVMLQNINYDLCNGIVAVWHDESHLNQYFSENEPTQKLSPAYCYPDCLPELLDNPKLYQDVSGYKRILLALTKTNAHEYRSK